MSDETFTGLHGLHGAKLLAAPTTAPKVHAAIPDVDPSLLPATYSAAKGRTTFPWWLNNSLGCCAETALAVALTNQATVSVTDNVPTYVEGFAEVTDADVSKWYHAIAKEEGEPFTTGEGPGTSPYALMQYVLQEKLVLACGVLGAVSADVIAQAIYDTDGGAIVTWALDRDFDQEFDDHKCWGAMSHTPDAQDGHATDGLGWGEGFTPLVDTWTRIQCTTEKFVADCQDGLILILTKPWVEQGGDLDAIVSKWGLTLA